MCKIPEEEKDFCTLLSELIIDERKAPKMYEQLISLLMDEEELLIPRLGGVEKWRKFIIDTMVEETKDISKTQKEHEWTLERMREFFCVSKEK